MKTFLIRSVWIISLIVYIVSSEDMVEKTKHRVLLLSFDGFRWDYVGRFPTPNLDSFAAEGVHAPVGVRTAFVTKTFPDHYTLVTGLYEESHGIIGNRMYDQEFNASFAPGNNETRWWDGGEPIWTTATLQGLKAGVFFWPGSEVELRQVRPYRWKRYQKNVSFRDRMDALIEWLVKDEVDLAASYFHEPDGSGHKFGALTPEVGVAVEMVDSLLGYLIQELKKEGIYDKTDILVVSDHGMTNVTADEDHVIVLEDYLNFEEDIFIMPERGALVNLLPKPGKLNDVYEKLRNAHPNMTVYRKEAIPERLHYKNHRRILPLVLVAHEGYYITQSRPFPSGIGPGEHGYDNNLQSMRPIFFARGPHFKAGYNVSSAFETINVYPLVCHLLNIQPAPNNGSLEDSLEMLSQDYNPASSMHKDLSLLLLLTTLFSIRIF